MSKRFTTGHPTLVKGPSINCKVDQPNSVRYLLPSPFLWTQFCPKNVKIHSFNDKIKAFNDKIRNFMTIRGTCQSFNGEYIVLGLTIMDCKWDGYSTPLYGRFCNFKANHF